MTWDDVGFIAAFWLLGMSFIGLCVFASVAVTLSVIKDKTDGR